MRPRSLLRQTNATLKIDETSVGTYGIESWIHFDIPQQCGSFLESFLEFCERLIQLAEASVDYGELVTRYAFFL